MGSLKEPIDTAPPTGIKVLIVGAGTSGLLLALECKRLGFHPTILERKSKGDAQGDFITVNRSAIKIFKHWPVLQADWNETTSDVDAFYYRYTGEHIAGPIPLKYSVGRSIVRADLQRMLEDAVHRQGIDLRYDTKVESYSEDSASGSVILAGGEHLAADLVVACDGIQSRAWLLVNGKRQKIVNSGHAIYRCALPKVIAFRDPVVKERFETKNGKPYMQWFSGPDTHAVMFYDLKTVCVSIHHPANENTSSESWSAMLDGKTTVEQLLQSLPDWDPTLLALLRTAPEKSINDWLLLYRDPEPNWVSPEGRVVLCGDSAHAFLPTSANGAGQAMEDAASLATILRLGYDASVSIKESIQVYNDIRFPRTSTAQLMGIITRQAHHKTDWEAVKQNPKILTQVGPGKWLSDHEPEQFALENFIGCLESRRGGKPFLTKSLPPGFTYRSWTCDEIFELERNDTALHLEGDWS